MPKESIIKHYSSSTTGSVPSAVDLVAGELAINTADEKIFFKNLGGSVVDLASSKAISGAYAAKALSNTFTASQNFSAGLSGNLTGNATTATTWQTTRTITIGDTGKSVNGSANVSWSVVEIGATSTNTANKIVMRDANGDFTGRYIFALYFNHSHSAAYRGADTQFYSSTDDYIRKNTKAGFLASLGLTNTASVNTVGTIVLRDGSGNFSAGTITATLSGTATQVSNALTIGSGLAGTSSTYNGSAAVTIANTGVLSLNGLTGARTLTGDGGAVVGVGNDTIRARLATASLTGVASFPATDFAVSAAGAVTLTGNVAKTNVAQTFTALQTFSVGISGIGATFSGHLSAATKSFVIPHPTVKGMELHHGSLEGPENGVYVRGHAHGRTVDLPHYWTGLVDESTITVQVTPFGRSQNLYVESVSIHQVVIGGDENPSYFYTIYGERKDVPKLKVEV